SPQQRQTLAKHSGTGRASYVDHFGDSLLDLGSVVQIHRNVSEFTAAGCFGAAPGCGDDIPSILEKGIYSSCSDDAACPSDQYGS
ncbi:MAG: hypothetical protein L0H31_03685, partial [Nocardioidaceae bacterium]|nr:hypothetical protein [Nocardioidaceae bacterium]